MGYSLAIPCYNQSIALEKALTGLRESECDEIIIMNIAPVNDDVQLIAEKYKCKVINFNKRVGYCEAINAAYVIASNYVICMHDDATPTPHCLDILYKYHKQHPNYLLSPNIKEEADNDFHFSGSNIEEIGYNHKYVGRMFVCWGCEKDIFFGVGKLDIIYDHPYYDDFDFIYRLIQKNYKLGVVKDSLMYHYGGWSIKRVPNFHSYIEVNKNTYIKKWGGVPCEEQFKTPYNV